MPEKLCSYQFLKDVLSGKKLVLHNRDVVRPVIPGYAQTSTSRLLDLVKGSEGTLKYMPE